MEADRNDCSDFRKATDGLKRRLGKIVRTDRDALFSASFDSSKLAFPIAAVIKPRKEADIGVVLRYANRHRVPVTPRGAGTSLTGSASPVRGGWVLDLSALRRVRIDSDAGMAHAQSGATVAAIQEAAGRSGWLYPPDPSSHRFCTIGGTIACNAGGMHGGKYGVTRDFVLALRGFLPTGEAVEFGRGVRKYAAGYNLRDLWIGSEGTLGVVTGAVLRLIPLPAVRKTMLVSFDDEAAAFRAARRLFAARIQPAVCEFLDGRSVEAAESIAGEPVFPGRPGRPVVLLEFAGSKAELAELTPEVGAWAASVSPHVKETSDRTEAERLWIVRRSCSSAMFAWGDGKLNEDVVIPLARYEQFGRFLARLSRRARLVIPTFGHLGDGNLHVNIMYHRSDPDECRRAKDAVQTLMREVVRLGGAISGEHGIGLAKSPFLQIEHSRAAINAMRGIKKALDPNGILNPGKIFEVFKVWEHPRVNVRLPWDH